jgi:hypothetical protein
MGFKWMIFDGFGLRVKEMGLVGLSEDDGFFWRGFGDRGIFILKDIGVWLVNSI